MHLISYAFMQRALLAALLSGLLAPAVGTYIVQRRLSLLGDGLGHAAIAGVGLAILTNQAPLPVAALVCVAGAVAIELLRQTGRASGDVGLAIMFYGGLAIGVMMAGLAGQGTATLQQYLFGSLTTVSTQDLVAILILALIVLIPSVGLMPQLFAVCADEEYAKVQGLPVRWLNLLIVAMAALTVTLSMRTVGLLLVSALMVVPVATAQNIFAGFKSTFWFAVFIGTVVSVGGTLLSAQADTPSGATIVVTAIIVFALSWPVSTLIGKIRAKRTLNKADPFQTKPSQAMLATGQVPVGQEAVLHGEHVDFVHPHPEYSDLSGTEFGNENSDGIGADGYRISETAKQSTKAGDS